MLCGVSVGPRWLVMGENVREVRVRCGICGVRCLVCQICFCDVKSERALHEALPRGWLGPSAHCEACHGRFVEMIREPCPKCPKCGSRETEECKV